MNGRTTASGPKKNRLQRILNSPDKDITRTYGANGVLSRLFRTILLDLKIGGSRFGQLMHEYITDPRNGVPNNRKDQTSMRGNLTKEFSREQMTWKVFVKALRFLQWTKVVFVLEAHHRDGRKSIHSTEVELSGQDEDVLEFERQLNQDEADEAIGEHVPVLDDFQEQARERAMQITTTAVAVNPQHWYIWSPSTGLIYEDLGDTAQGVPTPAQLNERFGAQMRRWSAVEPSAQLSMGMVVEGNVTGYWSEDDSMKRKTQTAANTEPVRGVADDDWYVWSPSSRTIYQQIGWRQAGPIGMGADPTQNETLARAIAEWKSLAADVTVAKGMRLPRSGLKRYMAPKQ